ncbi:MAG: methionyl-tRNA formyltransferase [Thermomicrobiales bacterium]
MVVPRPDANVPRPAPVIFFGTPAFAVPTLAALAEDARFAVCLVVTQPPRPVGRGREVQRSAVHVAADARGLPVFAPDRLRSPEVVSRLAGESAALFVVAAYGKILRLDVLNLPDHGTLNVHASLLPAYRGASPIAAAILDGVPETGVTIMLMDIGLDTGPILAQQGVAIAPDATTASLSATLAESGAPLLVDTAARWLDRQIEPEPQDDAAATVTRLLKKEDGAIDWHAPAARLARMERAYSPWPGLFTSLGGKRLIVHGVTDLLPDRDAPPGTIVSVGQSGMRVRTGAGDVLVARVQPEGKGAMTAAAFAAGHPNLVGTRLGDDRARDAQ